MQVACFIFIQRRWVDDKKHMENMLDYFCDIREPLQLLLFPEGTDLTGEKKIMPHPSMGLTDHILVAALHTCTSFQSSLRCLSHTFVLVLLCRPSDRAWADVLAYTSHIFTLIFVRMLRFFSPCNSDAGVKPLQIPINLIRS